MSENLREIMRGVRLHLTELIEGLDEQEVRTMSLGLAHTLPGRPAPKGLVFDASRSSEVAVQAEILARQGGYHDHPGLSEVLICVDLGGIQRDRSCSTADSREG